MTRRITDEKLPPIHPSPKSKGPIKVEEVEETANKTKGSSVPKLPKLVEENGSATTTAISTSGVGQMPDAAVASKRPQLAKVHKHLESVDFEDQDKIYVVEVS